ASNQHEELGLGTIAPFSTLLSTNTEGALQLASSNSGIGIGNLESSRDISVAQLGNIGIYPETAMHKDAYWFDQGLSASCEGYVLESTSVDAENNVLSQLQALDVGVCSDTESIEVSSEDYSASIVGSESDTTAASELETFSSEQSVNSEALPDCEPNVIRGPDDMYTPRWMHTASTRKVCVNVPEIYWWKHIQACIKRTWDE
ncbi:hypothetical protein GGI21_003604, partial [Coemansia aciculifera]